MSKSFKVAAVAAVTAIALTGCMDRYLSKAESTPARGTAFDNALARDYVKLAQVEYQSGDQKDGDTYSLRSVAAAQGQPTLPDDLRNRDIPSDKKGEVTQSRQRLVAALDRNNRTARPEVAAYAQATYDCWVEQLSENIQPDDIAACRDAFMKALAELEKPLPAPAPAAVKPSEFMVFFDWDRYNLTAEGQRILDQALAYIKQNNIRTVRVVGHTDTSGSPQYNLGLSKRRANAVAQYFEKSGIPRSAIQTEGVGETDLMVPTKDGVREPQNRRSVISFPKPSAENEEGEIVLYIGQS